MQERSAAATRPRRRQRDVLRIGIVVLGVQLDAKQRRIAQTVRTARTVRAPGVAGLAGLAGLAGPGDDFAGAP